MEDGIPNGSYRV